MLAQVYTKIAVKEFNVFYRIDLTLDLGNGIIEMSRWERFGRVGQAYRNII